MNVAKYMRDWSTLVGGVVTVSILAVLAVVVLTPSGHSKTATAYLERAVHLYPGSDVVVLGVKVGTVKDVVPDGGRVRVDFSYRDSLKLPANVHAIVLEPTIVADRELQLDPPYSSGPVLADKATIPLSRTAIPVELDEFNRSVSRLAQVLGPEGANRTGALARLVRVTAANLRGNGAAANATIKGLGNMVGTIGDDRAALFATVRNLHALVDTMARNDSATRSLASNLAVVSRFLDDQRREFGTALHRLGSVLDKVAGFIRSNRHAVASNISSLTAVTQVLARERTVLAQTLDAGAVGITNYPHMYSSVARAYNSRFVGNAFTDSPALFICQLFESAGGPAKDCLKYLKLLKGVPLPRSVTFDPTLGGVVRKRVQP